MQCKDQFQNQIGYWQLISVNWDKSLTNLKWENQSNGCNYITQPMREARLRTHQSVQRSQLSAYFSDRGIKVQCMAYGSAIDAIKQTGQTEKLNDQAVNICIDMHSMLLDYIGKQGPSFAREMEQQIETSDNKWRSYRRLGEEYSIFQPFRISRQQTELHQEAQPVNASQLQPRNFDEVGGSSQDLESPEQEMEFFMRSTKPGTFNFHLRQIYFIVAQLYQHFDSDRVVLVFPEESQFEHRQTKDYERMSHRHAPYDHGQQLLSQAARIQMQQEGSDYYGKRIAAAAIRALKQIAQKQSEFYPIVYSSDGELKQDQASYFRYIKREWSSKIFRELETELNISASIRSASKELSLLEVTELRQRIRYIRAPWVNLQHFDEQNTSAAQLAYFGRLGYLCFIWNPDTVNRLPHGIFLLQLDSMAICKYREQQWQINLNHLRIAALAKGPNQNRQTSSLKLIEQLWDENQKISEQYSSGIIFDSPVTLYDSILSQSSSQDPFLMTGLSQHSYTILYTTHHHVFSSQGARQFVTNFEASCRSMAADYRSKILMGYLLSAFHPVAEIDKKRSQAFGREYFEKTDGWRVRVQIFGDQLQQSVEQMRKALKQANGTCLMISRQYIGEFSELMRELRVPYLVKGNQSGQQINNSKLANSRLLDSTASGSLHITQTRTNQDKTQRSLRPVDCNVRRALFQTPTKVERDEGSDIDESQ